MSRRNLGLGSYPEVSFAEARDLRKLVRESASCRYTGPAKWVRMISEPYPVLIVVWKFKEWIHCGQTHQPEIVEYS